MNKIYIAHRGNINGKIEHRENSPDYIDESIKLGYHVEVDVRYIDGMFYLGHDHLQYGVTEQWLIDRYDKLWIHCKDIETLTYFVENPTGIRQGFFKYHRFFFHDLDEATLTSNDVIWTVSKTPIKNSIAVMPQLDMDITVCKGVCSDFVLLIKNQQELCRK